jgi:hypothetical protein
MGGQPPSAVRRAARHFLVAQIKAAQIMKNAIRILRMAVSRLGSNSDSGLFFAQRFKRCD